MKLVVWAHGALLRLCWWLLRLPFRAVWSTIQAVLVLLGEEFRRWAGLVVAGLLILGAGKATLNYAPAQIEEPLVLTVLLLVVIWALAVRRAVHFTLRNNLQLVRQRKAIREMAGDVKQLRLGQRIARTAKGTPIEGAFRSNREDRAREEERQAAAAEQAEAERAEADAEERELVRQRAAGADPDDGF